MEVSHEIREKSYYHDEEVGEEEESSKPLVEREHMFEKVVTPSDVGKLNRLVIPKQYAERYFPLDPSTGDKGLLLCFEEGSTGKPWRFRYSYWNSSQSYVMTKGWSRFVKEKQLDPGDTVSFGRGVGEFGRDRLFIDWRRRISEPLPMIPLRSMPWHSPPENNIYGGGSSSGGGQQYLYFRPPPLPPIQFGGRGLVLESVPVAQCRKVQTKRVLRLFGVNLECSVPDEDSQPKPPLMPLQWMVAPPRSESKPLLELGLRFKGKEEEEEEEEEG